MASSVWLHLGVLAAVLAQHPPVLPAADPPPTYAMVMRRLVTGDTLSGDGTKAVPPPAPRAAKAESPKQPPPAAVAPPAGDVPAPQPPPPAESKAAPPAPDAAADTADATDDTTPAQPETARNAPPAYPLESERRGEQGLVSMLIHVSPDGRAAAVDITASSGFPRLDAAARQTVLTWHFRPAQRGGVAVASVLAFNVHYLLPRPGEN